MNMYSSVLKQQGMESITEATTWLSNWKHNKD